MAVKSAAIHLQFLAFTLAILTAGCSSGQLLQSSSSAYPMIGREWTLNPYDECVRREHAVQKLRVPAAEWALLGSRGLGNTLHRGKDSAAAPSSSPTACKALEGKAFTYVYRPIDRLGSNLEPIVICGSESSALGPGEYFLVVTDPGPVTCRVSTETAAGVGIEPVVGDVKYVKLGIGWGLLVGRPYLEVVDPSIALREVPQCKRVMK